MALSKILPAGQDQFAGARNLVTNGAMQVWQRGTSDDTASNGAYTCDRWGLQFDGLDGNVDWDQETSSVPDGFAYALKVSTDASESSLDAADFLKINQRFEGQNLQHLQKGASGAKSITLSFWVKSSVASTYTLELEDRDNTRVIGKSYTINSADTWEHKSVVFEGDTSGPYTNDANESLRMSFYIDAGSNYTSGTFSTAWQATDATERVYDTTGWLESTSPEFYITGVQLELGETATAFEHRSFGDELARCQRYFWKPATSGWQGQYINTLTNVTFVYPYPVTMRATPSVTAAGGFKFNKPGSAGNITATYNANEKINNEVVAVNYNGASTNGNYGDTAIVSVGDISISAEL
jgi:hypothetical protein